MSETYREAIERDSFRAGWNHGDQGHEMDVFKGQFDAPEDYEAWVSGWVEGKNFGPHRIGYPDPAAAEKAWQLWVKTRKAA